MSARIWQLDAALSGCRLQVLPGRSVRGGLRLGLTADREHQWQPALQDVEQPRSLRPAGVRHYQLTRVPTVPLAAAQALNISPRQQSVGRNQSHANGFMRHIRVPGRLLLTTARTHFRW